VRSAIIGRPFPLSPPWGSGGRGGDEEGGVKSGGLEERLMAKDDGAVAGEVQIGFDAAGDAGVEGPPRRRAACFSGLRPAGPPRWPLQVERRHDRGWGKKRTSPGLAIPGEADVKEEIGAGKCVRFPDPTKE